MFDLIDIYSMFVYLFKKDTIYLHEWFLSMLYVYKDDNKNILKSIFCTVILKKEKSQITRVLLTNGDS